MALGVLVWMSLASPAAGQAVGGVVVVRMETASGDITAEIFVGAAPVTANNFLDYVDDGVYDAGTFYRSVRMDNQPNDSVRIEVIQAGVDRSMRERMRPAIPLERTAATGLSHVDGALSKSVMGRLWLRYAVSMLIHGHQHADRCVLMLCPCMNKESSVSRA